jgi:uncharacterized protein
MNLTLLYWIVIAVMLVGIVGAIIPGLPGTSLILIAITVWYVATGFAGIGWPLVAIFAILVLSAAVEFLATYWGVQRLGASKWAQYGAIAGLVFGILGLLPALPFGGPLLGIFLGPVFGAFVGEFLYRRELSLDERTQLSLKASLGVFVGTIVGNLIEGLLAIAAVVVFIFSTWPPVG